VLPIVDRLAITFSSGFAGNQVLYLAARNNSTCRSYARACSECGSISAGESKSLGLWDSSKC
jgi:hypothetical protein